MVNLKLIQDKMLALVGWRQDFDAQELLSKSVTESETGLYFQDSHPLLTLNNMRCIAPDFSQVQYPSWFSNTQFKSGVVVENSGSYFRAIKDSTGVSTSDTEFWEETTPFSEWLEQKTRACIQKVIMRFLNDKAVKGTVKDLFENRTLFDGTGRLTDLVKNKQNLVGFEVVPVRSAGVTTKINKIGLQFTEPGTYKIYIFHSSSSAPVYTISLTKTKKNSMEWFNVEDIYLPYESQHNDAGGSWFVCYFQSELPEGSNAIRKERDWSKGPCNACSRREYEAWMAWSKYLEIHPFYVNEELIDKEEDDSTGLWDIEDNQYTYDTNYGLNLEISISCDLTDFIIKQRHLFQDVISKQLAMDMLRELAYNANVRTNRHAINASRVDILYEIDGDSSQMKPSGLSAQLEKAFKAIELSTEGLDRICQPCVNHGIKYRTV